MSAGQTPYTTREMIRDIGLVVQAVIIAVMGWWTSQNRNATEKIEQIQQTQQTAEQRLEERMAKEGIQLYSTWKYLEDIAESTNLPKDKFKAAEAKKVYEEHLHLYSEK